MRQPLCLATAFLAVAAALAALLGVPAEAAKADKSRSSRWPVIRLGIVETVFRGTPEPVVQVMLRPFKALMEQQTGVTSVLVNGGDAEHLGAQIMEDKLQLGVFHGFEFAWTRLKYRELKPMLIAINREPYCRALLVVRDDSAAAGVADLKGKTLALPQICREHCRLFLERRCASPGAQPHKQHSEILTAADPEEALDLVMEGKAAAAVVDQMEFDQYRKDKPGRARRLKFLSESEPFPSAVVAYNPAVMPRRLAEHLTQGMVGAKDTRKGQEMLQLCGITAFEEVPDHYEQMLDDIAKAYPPLNVAN